MEANIRELKARLSRYIRTAAAGEDVSVSIHGRVVARIVGVGARREVSDLADQPGITWNGGKPRGMAKPQALSGNVLVSDWVTEDRR